MNNTLNDIIMNNTLNDINGLRTKLKEILEIIEEDVDASMEGWREYVSYSKSEADLVDYYHIINSSIEKVDGKTYIAYGVSETQMDIRISGRETNEPIEITYYPADNKNHIPYMREMLIIDALYNSKEQEKSVNEYVNYLNNLNDKINEFKSILENLGAKDPIEINLLTKVPNLNKKILNNLVTYAFDEEMKNRLLTEEELTTLNSLEPIEFEINLNFYTSDEQKHLSFVNNLFRNFMLDIDINKYIEKDEREQLGLRDFCLSSINKENKERQCRKKV